MVGEAVAGNSRTIRAPDALTAFSYVWAAQTLVQLVFFNGWASRGDPLGWIYLILTLGVFLFPGRIRLFAAMLVAGVVYYISIWPFVVNHVMADTIIVFALLGAAAMVLGLRLFSPAPLDRSDAEAWFMKFAPVAGAIFTFMYYSITLSKLNHGFFDLDISCMSTMHQDFLVQRPSFAPLILSFDSEFLFWMFIVIEVAIPLLLTFGPTRILAMYVGVPFHVLLGLMGHWPFSSMMLSLYVLIAMPSFLELLAIVAARLEALRLKLAPWAPGAVAFAVLNALLLGSMAIGVKPSFIWLVWTVPLAAGLLLATVRSNLLKGPFYPQAATRLWTWKPGWLWIMLVLAMLNTASPYIGFKTHTAVAMYSNMRTEGDQSNHFFVPNAQIFDFQKDLVEIVDSNHETIRDMKTAPARFGFVGEQFPVYVTYFELRRAVSTLKAEDLEVTYIRNGEPRTWRRGAANNVDANLDRPLPLLLAKLGYFRPIFKERSYCLH